MEEDAEDGQGVYQCTIKYNGTLAEEAEEEEAA